MSLLLLAYLGGVLTIISPCILPVLPFVFSRIDRPFLSHGLPMLVGMALTFAAVASLAAVGGGWVVALNEYGRWAAMALMAFFAVTLLWPPLAERLTRPLVALGSRLSESADQAGGSTHRWGSAMLLGVATGLLWAPCAGPILGLILTGAALQGANLGSSLLLLAFALGAASSLAVVLLLGNRLTRSLKKTLGVSNWLKRGLGVAMLAGVGAIALGLDTGLLAQLSVASTGSVEQRLVDQFGGQVDDNGPAFAMQAGPAMMVADGAMMAAGGAMMAAVDHVSDALPVEGLAPDLLGATDWINSAPLNLEALRGKVVIVDFWTYSCINCLRTVPYLKAWDEKYRDQGLVLIGVHAPEFAFERRLANVEKATRDLGITYPVALDNGYDIWRAYRNRYWPAKYFIDAQGRIRYHHFGEGNYAESERVIQQLLAEAGATNVAQGLSDVDTSGVHQAADARSVRSHETYLGYQRTENFVAMPALVQDQTVSYHTPDSLTLNTWGLDGDWQIGAERSTLNQGSGRITYRFHARDVNLVLAPDEDGKPVRFRVLIDGQAPQAAHGIDVDADGAGVVTEQRLYQLVRQNGPITDRTLSIEFLDPGISAYAFTFG